MCVKGVCGWRVCVSGGGMLGGWSVLHASVGDVIVHLWSMFIFSHRLTGQRECLHTLPSPRDSHPTT